MNLSTNPIFWLGQIGLTLTVLYGMAILLSVYQRAPRYYTVAVLFFVGMAFFNLGHPFMADGRLLPAAPNLFRFSVGLATTAGFYLTRERAVALGYTIPSYISRYLLIGALSGAALLLLMALVLKTREQNELIRERITTDKKQNDAVLAAIRADTVQRAELKADLDSTNALLRRQRQATETARRDRNRIERKADAIKRDTETMKKELSEPPTTQPNADEKSKKPGLLRRIFGHKPDRRNDSTGAVAHH